MAGFELKFDPKTIQHLGVKMYATLPPALAELISNAYDADASEVKIEFFVQNGTPRSITVYDNGDGMSAHDIQNKFLVIGRNRRIIEGDQPSSRFGRLPTGKKGLGKLAMFGLAKTITVDTSKNYKRNRFELDWDNLLSSDQIYNPNIIIDNEDGKKEKGTVVQLSELKRKTNFDIESIADNLSKIFIVDESFKIILKDLSSEKEIEIKNDRRYKLIEKQFEWHKEDLVFPDHKYYDKIEIDISTSKTPISPNSGMRGITLFSRGKLVNAPEYFSSSTSSHFFEYLTGSIHADFIDLIDEDVISTNRQSISWDHPEMTEFRLFLQEIIAVVNKDWRKKRADLKEKIIKEKTGIDKQEWIESLPKGVKEAVTKIVNVMSKDDEISTSFTPILTSLYEIVPAYPQLHWRHLHHELRNRVQGFYQNKQYVFAADQGVKIYAELLRKLTGVDQDGTNLANLFIYPQKNHPLISIADLDTSSGRNMQEGQQHLTRGVMSGFRNPINHAPVDKIVPEIFSELDCLNVLSLISYLITRLDGAQVLMDKNDRELEVNSQKK